MTACPAIDGFAVEKSTVLVVAFDTVSETAGETLAEKLLFPL